MSDLLTHEVYCKIASELTFPENSFIDGIFRPAKSGNTFVSTNPATNEKLADVASCNGDDIDDAVAAAKTSFENGAWRSLSPGERKHVLIGFADLIEQNKTELAVMECVDSGKPIQDCELIDVPETVETIKWHAELLDKLYDQTAPVGDGALAVVVREPVGVVGCVLPWNFPMLMMAWKIGPALAAGCSVVVKPAEQTNFTALRIAELAIEAGIPAGVLNVVTGMGPDVGQPLGLHPDVKMVSFTGSTETGRRFLRYSADSNLKEIVLECGGKNPCVVLDDARDLDEVADHVANGAFWNMGENCSAISRLIVHEDIKEDLVNRVIKKSEEWIVGDPLDPATKIGALIDTEHFSKVCSYIDKGQESSGVSTLLGGTHKDGSYVMPTVFDTDGSEQIILSDEIFGPVLSVVSVKSFDEAIARANDTEYGLAGSIFTRDVSGAINGAREIQAGTVTVNCYGEGDITTPFGGFKMSGFGGRDNSAHAHDQYTQIKTIWVDLDK